MGDNKDKLRTAEQAAKESEAKELQILESTFNDLYS